MLKYVCLTIGVFCSIVFSSAAVSQSDFEDELEAELEAELGLEEEISSESLNEPSDEFKSSEKTSEEPSESNAGTTEENQFSEFGEEPAPKVGDEPGFSQEEFGDSEFGEDAFSAEDADFSVEGEMDFSDFDEEFSSEEPKGAVPLEEGSVQESIGDLELQPLETDDESDKPLFEEPVAEPELKEDPNFQAPTFSTPFETAGPPAGSDPPNLDYEARLYNIYVNFHSQPTPKNQWEAMVAGQSTETYTIQTGDTLWEISKTFFNDGGYWPKIWSLNSRIENPHLIAEGNRISFLMGTEGEPPLFTISDRADKPETELEKTSDQAVVEMVESGLIDPSVLKQEGETKEPEPKTSKPRIDEQAASTPSPDIEIPPPRFTSRPVLRRLPPSVPEWQSADPKGEYDDAGIDYGRRPILDVKDELYLPSYVDEKRHSSDASIIEIEAGSRIAWELQYVFVKFPKGKGIPGEKYLVVENNGALAVANNAIIERDRVYQKIISGEITVGEKVEADVDEDFEVYRAFVDKAIHPIRLGGELIKGGLERVNLEQNGARSEVVAQIIGGMIGNRQQIFSINSFVYLNRGAIDGLQIGQVLPIRANRKARKENTIIMENDRVLGYLKIAQVTDKYSTAVVTSAWDNIYSGDFTGRGPFMDRADMKMALASSPEGDKNIGELPSSTSSSDSVFQTNDSDFSQELDALENEFEEFDESGEGSEFE